MKTITFPNTGKLKLVLLLTAAAATTTYGAAISTFDTGADGWTAIELVFPSAGAPYNVLGTSSSAWASTGGNPGGYVTSGANLFGSTTVYWSAPAKFLGNISAAQNGNLTFDLFNTGGGSHFNTEDVIIVSPTRTLVFDLPADPGTLFTSFSVPLDGTSWRLNSLSGAAATQSDMTTALSNASAIYVRAEYILGSDTRGIDNVSLPVPEPSTAAILAATALFIGAVRRHRK